MIWSACVFACLAFFAIQWYLHGLRIATGRTAPLTFLVPVWIVREIGPFPFDVKLAAASAILVMHLIDRAALREVRLTVLDGCVALMMLVHVVSDSYNDGASVFILLRALGEWGVPYLLGRASVEVRRGVSPLLSTACFVVTVLGAWAVAEAITRENPAARLFGERPELHTPLVQMRFDLKRAEGPTVHPIWLAMVFALFVPFCAAAAWECRRTLVGLWRLAAPVALAAGMAATVSRGPPAVVLSGSAIALAARNPRLRRPLFVLACLAIAAAAVGGDRLLAMLKWTADRPPGEKKNEIVVDGQRHELDETTHRALQYRVYREAMLRAGWLGFGTQRISVYPVQVPVGRLDPETMRRVWTIDSQYILVWLRFGALGVVAFVVLMAGCAVTTLRNSHGPQADGPWSAWSGGITAGLAVVLLVEWMPHDYGFVLLWMMGLAATLSTRKRLAAEASRPAAPPHHVRRTSPRADRPDFSAGSG